MCTSLWDQYRQLWYLSKPALTAYDMVELCVCMILQVTLARTFHHYRKVLLYWLLRLGGAWWVQTLAILLRSAVGQWWPALRMERGMGGQKVMGYTIASHTAFKRFSLRHSRNRTWVGLDNMYVLLFALWKIGLWCWFCSGVCFVSDTVFSRKHRKENTLSEAAPSSLARRLSSSPFREQAQWIKNDTARKQLDWK